MTTTPEPGLSSLQFDESGLIPAVIQDTDTDAVLMVGFMNRAALEMTRQTGRVHFWSRGRGKLWRKGETSGHEQLVEDLYVNCELNSLLVTVRQVGAVCHEGFPTCFYRRVEHDGALTEVAERVFDPETVYGSRQRSPADDLLALSREWLGAYEYLRDHDLSAVSSTSSRLRSAAAAVHQRIADELRELAGVIDGSHSHVEVAADVLLEGSQVLYWVALAALRDRVGWDRLRPDRALLTGDDDLPAPTAAKLLHREATAWEAPVDLMTQAGARYHATIALVAQACRSMGVDPASLVRTDLAALRTKPYLAPFFAPQR